MGERWLEIKEVMVNTQSEPFLNFLVSCILVTMIFGSQKFVQIQYLKYYIITYLKTTLGMKMKDMSHKRDFRLSKRLLRSAGTPERTWITYFWLCSNFFPIVTPCEYIHLSEH